MTAQIDDVRQHLLIDVYTNMMAEHMRARQTAACDAPRLPESGTYSYDRNRHYQHGLHTGVGWVAESRFGRDRHGSTALGRQEDRDWFLLLILHGIHSSGGHGVAAPTCLCKSGKSSFTYHDIPNFVTNFVCCGMNVLMCGETIPGDTLGWVE